MTTKPDFAQKLLHDLRQRKQRMAAPHNSSNSSFVPADAYGSSRQVLKGPREIKRLQTVGPKIGSKYKISSISHESPATVQATNQIVAYGGHHRSGERGDLSMALQYAFDNGGKLKRIDFTSSSKMKDFLQQIGKRSFQQSSNMQWPSTNQFPTLTRLHIDEIARGAQKLNQILIACSDGLNIDKGTLEIGKELWQGAIELEQSLKMLVSLQEASESLVSPKRKSNVKLLEEGEDGKEDSKSSTEKQKKVERPVFSFDKASKSKKGTAHTPLQQNLMALTYLKEDPNPEPEKQEYMAPNSTSHRRSASCGPEISTSQHTSSSKQKHDTGIPNIIAKLMGLEELSQKVNPKVHTERESFSKQKSVDMASTRIANASSRAAEVKMEYANKVQHNQNSEQSNKIALFKYHEPGLQRETFRLTYDCSHRAMTHSHKPMLNGEREAIRNNLNEPQAAISKINELQSQIMQKRQNSSIHKDIRQETRLSSEQRRQQEVNDDMKTFQKKVQERNQNSEAADSIQNERLANLHNQTEKRATNKSVLRKTEVKSKQLDSSQNVASHVKKLQRQQPVTKNPISTKENNAETKGLTGSKGLSSSAQTKEPANDGKVTDSYIKQRSSLSFKPEQQSTSADRLSGRNMTQAQIVPNTNAKLAHLSAKKVVDEIKPQKMGSTKKSTKKTTEVITRSVKNAKKTARILKPHISTPEESQKRDSKFKPAQMTQDNVRQTDLESQQVDAEEMVTMNDPIHDLQSEEKTVELSPNEKAQNTKTSKDSDNQYNQENIPGEVQEIRPQSPATDIITGSTDISYDLQPKQQRPPKIEKPEPLTEDEVYLKQKLITSHLFLNTAEALFKLNIPIGILNYAIDQCQEKDNRLILDCGYEVLKRKGRRQEIILHPHINQFTSSKKVRSLDDLVRQLHKEFESLRSYGRNGTAEHDYAEHILRMLERDIHYTDPDINCMWDLGWNEAMFSYVEMDEVITDMEHKILDELMNELAEDCMLSPNFIAARPRDIEDP